MLSFEDAVSSWGGMFVPKKFSQNFHHEDRTEVQLIHYLYKDKLVKVETSD